jgi:excisionase family DNA binding protein
MNTEAKAKPTCLLTTEQAAADLSMSPRTLLRLRKTGAIRGINVGAGERTHWRFDSDAIDRFKRDREQAERPAALPQVKRERRPARRRLVSREFV